MRVGSWWAVWLLVICACVALVAPPVTSLFCTCSADSCDCSGRPMPICPGDPRCPSPPGSSSCPASFSASIDYTCLDLSGVLWQSVHLDSPSYRYKMCPWNSGPAIGTIRIFQGGTTSSAPWSCSGTGTYHNPKSGLSVASTTGDGSDDTCINNVPFEVSLSKASGPYSYGGSTQDNCLGCGHAANSYVVSSTSYKVAAEFSSVPQGNWYSWGDVNYLSYELFSSATPSSHSGQRFTNENNIWTSTGPDRVNMYDDAYPANNFYYCCGAYKEAKAGSAGVDWTAAGGTSLIVSNKASSNVCCTPDQCVGNDGACINEGVVNPGHGYSGTNWICGTTGSGPFDVPLFMKGRCPKER